jgi:hypothetical protein
MVQDMGEAFSEECHRHSAGRAWGTEAKSILSFQLCFRENGDKLRSVSLLGRWGVARN